MNTEKNKPPYVGPRTFEPEERDRFFGREREARDLFARVVSERLILFYAQSGAGKSSLVNTCLIPDLKARKFVVFPVGRVGGEALPGIEVKNIFVYNLVNRLTKSAVKQDGLEKLSIADLISKLMNKVPSASQTEEEDQSATPHVLVIDQFEELFSTHAEAWTKREDFFQQLAEAMEDHPYLRVVLVMREDYIASLDPYAHLLPGRLGRRYYMQRLEREAAIKAVRGPVEELRPFAPGVAEKLVDDLSSIKVQKPDGTQGLEPGQYVEPVQLQVVCHSLWSNLSPGGTSITDNELSTVGDVDDALGKYYAQRIAEVAQKKNVKERLIREWIETKLIATGGIRSMVLREAGGKSGGISDNVIQELQSDLVRAENRGGAIWYELTHDRLVGPILENNKIWFDANLSPLQRQAALWHKQDKDKSWLLRDQALVEAENWAKENELTDPEGEFLEASQAEEKEQREREEQRAMRQRELEMARNLAEEQAKSAEEARRFQESLAQEQLQSARRARGFTALASGLLIIAIFATIFAFSKQKAAEQEADKAIKAQTAAEAAQADAKQKAAIARSRELSALAQGFYDSKLDLATLLGIEGNRLDTNSQVQSVLLTLMQKSGRYLGKIDSEEEILQIQYAPNGKTFASLDKNGITLWDANSRKRLSDTSINGHFAAVTALTLSKDGGLMASGGSNGTIVIWDAVKREMLSQPFLAHKGWISGLAFSTDAKTLAVASNASNNNGGPVSDESTISLWDVTDPGHPKQIDSPISEHQAPVYSLAFSPDGKILASGEEDASIILWNLKTGQPEGDPLNGHQELVISVAFSPDGKTLASASYDDTVILWDVSDPTNPIQKGEPLAGSPIDLEIIAFSPDGKILASGNDEGNIILWDTQTRQPIGEPLHGSTSWVISLAFSPDGKTLAAGSYYDASLSHATVILWDVEKHAQIGKQLDDHTSSVSGVAFSPDGKTLVSASQDSTIIFWDVSDVERPQKLGPPLQGHPGQPTGMGYSPDSNLLISYGDDGSLLFDVKSQKPLGPGDIFASPNGKIWAYQTLDQTSQESLIQLRDAATGDAIGNPIPGKYIAFSPDSQILVYQTTDPDTKESFLHLWDIAATKNIGEAVEGTYLAFNSNSQTLVYQPSTETDRTSIVFWNVATGSLIDSVGSTVSDHAIPSQDGTRLAFVDVDENSGEHVINLLDTATGKPLIEQIKGIDVPGLSANGKVLLYYSSDPQSSDAQGTPLINVLDTVTNKAIGQSHSGYLNGTAEVGQTMAYSLYTEGKPSILVIDTASGKEVAELPGTLLGLIREGETLVYENEGINLFDVKKKSNIGKPIKGTYMGISPDGETLAARDESNAIILWDLSNTWLLGQPISEKTDKVSSAIVSPDGKMLAFARDTSIALQDMAAGKIINTFPNEHSSRVNSVILSPDQQTLLSIGEEGKIIIWDLTTLTPLGEPMSGAAATFSPDGKLVAVGDENKSITLWDLTARTQQMINEAPVGKPIMFSPDGKLLAVYARKNNSITLFDVTTHQTVGKPIQGDFAIGAEADNTLLVVNPDQNTTTFWDWETREPSAKPISGSDSYIAAENLEVLVVQDSIKNMTTLWNVETRKQIGQTLTGIYDPTFSPDGTLMSAADSESNTTYLFDLKTQNLVGSKQGYYWPIFCSDNRTVAFVNSSEANMILSHGIGEDAVEETIQGIGLAFSLDCTRAIILRDSDPALLWDVENGRELGELSEGDNAVFSIDGTKVAVADSEANITSFWNVNNIRQFGDQAPVGILNFSSQNRDLLQLYDTDGIEPPTLWNLNTGTSLSRESYDWDFSPIFDTDGRLITYNNKGVTFWDIKNNKRIGEPLRGHLAPIAGLLFSPNGKTLASLASDGIVLTNLATQASTHLETGDYANQLTQMAFSTDGTSLTALGNDGTILRWDITRSPPLLRDPLDAPNKDATYNGYRAVLSPDGKYLIYRDTSKLNIWDIDQEKSVRETTVANPNVFYFNGGNPGFGAITFSPDGNSMFYNDGSKIFQWDGWSSSAAGSKPIQLLSAGQNQVSGLGLVMGDKAPQYLLITSYPSTDMYGTPIDQSTQIWELSNDSKVGEPLSDYLQTISPNTQSNLLIYINNDSRLIKSDLNPSSLASVLCEKAGRNFTQDEWTQYFPKEPYRKTCDQWPPAPEATEAQAP